MSIENLGADDDNGIGVKPVAANIRDLRHARSWSARELSDRCRSAGATSLTRQAISNIENGSRKSVTSEEISVLASIFDVTIEFLLHGQDRPRERPRTHAVDFSDPLQGVSSLRLPADEEAERNLIQIALTGAVPAATFTQGVHVHDFYSEVNASIYEAIVNLVSRDAPVNQHSVQVEAQREQPDMANDIRAYLSGVMGSAPVDVSFEYLVERVRELAVRRRLISAGQRSIQLALMEASTDEILDRAQSELFRVRYGAPADSPARFQDLLPLAADRIEVAAERGGISGGVSTGLSDLDSLIGGFIPGTLTLLSSTGVMGKSSLALHFSRICSFREKRPSIVFSLQMRSEEVMSRLLSAETSIPISTLRSGRLRESQWETFATRTSQISAAPLTVDDSPLQSLSDIRAKVRVTKERNGLSLVVIDTAELVRISDRLDSREVERSVRTTLQRELKLLARELEVPVLLVSGSTVVYRAASSVGARLTADYETHHSDEADVVLNLTGTAGASTGDSGRPTILQLRIDKNRSGPRSVIQIGFEPFICKFSDLEH